MLVLSRKRDEEIVINTPGGLITLTVTELRGGKVRLGIEAPRGYHILRSELIDHDSPSTEAPQAA